MVIVRRERHARVGATDESQQSTSSSLLTVMLAALGLITFIGLFAAGEAVSGRDDRR
jgi:hypothetical protein